MMELVEKLCACFFGCSCKGDARSRPQRQPRVEPRPPTRNFCILISLPYHYITTLTQADWGCKIFCVNRAT